MDDFQSYQDVSKIILEELVLEPVDFKKVNYQKYFYDLKTKEPEKYKRLAFDTNGAEPYSEDLSSIFFDFLLCGFVDFHKNIEMKSIERIRQYVSSE